MGVGEEAPNVLKPNIYGFGLVTVGEKAVIPDGVTIGKNVCISGETSLRITRMAHFRPAEQL